MKCERKWKGGHRNCGNQMDVIICHDIHDSCVMEVGFKNKVCTGRFRRFAYRDASLS
jgi:hypothetical protein